MAQPTPLRSARRYHLLSARAAARAARMARSAYVRGGAAAASVTVARYQAGSAELAWAATAAMLVEQGVVSDPEAAPNLAGFASDASVTAALIESTAQDAARFDRLALSLVQDAARAAQGVAVAIQRTEKGWVRHLTLPSCDRCAVLAGRVYRYSQGFQRHPGCDCTMVPTTVGNLDMTYDVPGLVEAGQVTGLSKADSAALADGADFNKIVNVRSKTAGLSESGRVLARGGRLTPEGIYRIASDRQQVLDLLRANRYIL